MEKLSLFLMTAPAKLLFIVKANSYGHGAAFLANMAQKERLVSCFGVSSVEEGIALRRSGITLPVLVLGSLYPFKTFVAAIEENLTITVASLDAARQLVAAAESIKKTALCHIKLDTGMSAMSVFKK